MGVELEKETVRDMTEVQTILTEVTHESVFVEVSWSKRRTERKERDAVSEQ